MLRTGQVRRCSSHVIIISCIILEEKSRTFCSNAGSGDVEVCVAKTNGAIDREIKGDRAHVDQPMCEAWRDRGAVTLEWSGNVNQSLVNHFNVYNYQLSLF